MQKIKVDLNIGNNMRELRKKHGYRQDDIVAQIDILGVSVTRSTYSRYETGELNVPVSVLVALNNLYGCSYDEFFIGLKL